MTAPIPYKLPPTDWPTALIRHVEFWSLLIPAAAEELARRYAADLDKTPGEKYSATYQHMLRVAFKAGWHGTPNRYHYNWQAPLKSAYRSGSNKRRELETLANKDAPHGLGSFNGDLTP